jgi:hypothetical protein
MKKTYLIILFCLIFSAANSIAQVLCINCYNQNNPVSTNITNMVVNGSFEDFDTINPGGIMFFCPNSPNYSISINNWNCSGGGTGTYASMRDNSFTYCPDSTHCIYFGNWYCRACSPVNNDTSCLVNLGCTVTGTPPNYPESDPTYGGSTGLSVSQLVTGLIPGNVYVLEFWVGGEEGFTIDGVFAVDIGFGDTLLRCPQTNMTLTGRRYIVQFAATNTFHPLKFTNWGHICSSCTELILDDVRVYPISQLSSIIPACALKVDEPDAENNYTVEINHTTGKLNVVSIINNYSLKIYNVEGQQVFNQSYSGNASANINQLKPGVYFYEVSNGRESVQNKFIMQ